MTKTQLLYFGALKLAQTEMICNALDKFNSDDKTSLYNLLRTEPAIDDWIDTANLFLSKTEKKVNQGEGKCQLDVKEHE